MVFQEPNCDRLLPTNIMIAELAGVNSEIAVADALPLQYVLRAVPVHAEGGHGS